MDDGTLCMMKLGPGGSDRENSEGVDWPRVYKISLLCLLHLSIDTTEQIQNDK